MEFFRESFELKASALGRDKDLVKRLADYAVSLSSKGLPVIFSPKHWSLLMGTRYELYHTVLKNRENFYTHFNIKKKTGGERAISAPEGEIRNIQYWIKETILDNLKFPEYVTAYQKKRSIVDNARPHVRKEIIIKFDLVDFFNTITEARVYGLFQILGYHKSVAVDLAKACCVKLNNDRSVLPQGAPTSPGLANLACSLMDLRLSKYASSLNYSYSRYADDLTFSGSKATILKPSTINKIVVTQGFILNEKKQSYRQRNSIQQVTGLNVNEGISISKKFRKKIETEIHNCVRFGPYTHLGRVGLAHKINYREWLLGNILYIYSVHPKQGKIMREKFEKISWI